jgi:hypothetical protein
MDTLTFDGMKLTVEKRHYTNGRVALVLVDPNGEFGPEDYMVATVNLPDVELKEGEVVVKDYSENEGIFSALKEAGIVSEPVRWVHTGFVKCPVCKLLA